MKNNFFIQNNKRLFSCEGGLQKGSEKNTEPLRNGQEIRMPEGSGSPVFRLLNRNRNIKKIIFHEEKGNYRVWIGTIILPGMKMN